MDIFQGRRNCIVILAVLASGSIFGVVSPQTETAFALYDEMYSKFVEVNGDNLTADLPQNAQNEMRKFINKITEEHSGIFKNSERFAKFAGDLHADVGCAYDFVRKYMEQGQKSLAASLYMYYLTCHFARVLEIEVLKKEKKNPEKKEAAEGSQEKTITRTTNEDQDFFLLFGYIKLYSILCQNNESLNEIRKPVQMRGAEKEYVDVGTEIDESEEYVDVEAEMNDEKEYVDVGAEMNDEKVNKLHQKFLALERNSVLAFSEMKLKKVHGFIESLLLGSGLSASLPILSAEPPSKEMVADLKLWDQDLKKNESRISKIIQALMQITAKEEIIAT